jgi:hypothetical protein
VEVVEESSNMYILMVNQEVQVEVGFNLFLPVQWYRWNRKYTTSKSTTRKSRWTRKQDKRWSRWRWRRWSWKYRKHFY